MFRNKRTITEMIFNTLDFDKGRGGHTVESLLQVFSAAEVIGDPRASRVSEWEVRCQIAELMQKGRLDMTNLGILFPVESEVKEALLFEGYWYVVTEGGVRGPLVKGSVGRCCY